MLQPQAMINAPLYQPFAVDVLEEEKVEEEEDEQEEEEKVPIRQEEEQVVEEVENKLQSRLIKIQSQDDSGEMFHSAVEERNNNLPQQHFSLS